MAPTTTASVRPSTFKVVEEAIRRNNNDKGCSVIAIKRYIHEAYGEHEGSLLKQLKPVVERALETGALKRPRGHGEQRGLTGSLLLGDTDARKAPPSSATKPKPLAPSKKENTEKRPVNAAGTSKSNEKKTLAVKVQKKPSTSTPRPPAAAKQTVTSAAAATRTPTALKKASSNAALNETITKTPTSIMKSNGKGSAPGNRLVFARPLISTSSPNLNLLGGVAGAAEKGKAKQDKKRGQGRQQGAAAKKALPAASRARSPSPAPLRRSISVPAILVSPAADALRHSGAMSKGSLTSLSTVSLHVSNSADSSGYDYSDYEAENQENVAPAKPAKRQQPAKNAGKTAASKATSKPPREGAGAAKKQNLKASSAVASASSKSGSLVATKPSSSKNARKLSSLDPLFYHPKPPSVSLATDKPKQQPKTKAAPKKSKAM